MQVQVQLKHMNTRNAMRNSNASCRATHRDRRLNLAHLQGKALAHAAVAVHNVDEAHAGAHKDLQLAVAVEVSDNGVAVAGAEASQGATKGEEGRGKGERGDVDHARDAQEGGGGGPYRKALNFVRSVVRSKCKSHSSARERRLYLHQTHKGH